MRPFPFIIVIFFAIPTWNQAKVLIKDGETTPSMNPTPAAENSQLAPEETLYRFQSQTVWGQVIVLIRDLSDQFKVEVKSEALASGWIFKNGKTSQTLSKGGLNSLHQFQFLIPQPFAGPFRLTIFLNSDREQVPVVIPLEPGSQNKPESPPAESLEDYEENPDHPYNNTVKNLYDKAVEDFAKGDTGSALERLRKAEKLDPRQPQVQSLILKITSSGQNEPKDLMAKAQTDLKSGNKEAALAEITDYLDQYPKDEKGLKLKDQIEGKDESLNPVKKKIKKNISKEQPSPISKPGKIRPPNSTTEDIQAQADQTYNLGLDSYRKGDYAAAKKFWEQTLQIQPNHPQAQRNIDRLKEEHPDLP